MYASNTFAVFLASEGIMGKEWVQVRIERRTWEQLQALRLMFESQYLRGQLPDMERHDRFGISLSSVVDVLINRDWEHRERAAGKTREELLRKALATLADMGVEIFDANG